MKETIPTISRNELREPHHGGNRWRHAGRGLWIRLWQPVVGPVAGILLGLAIGYRIHRAPSRCAIPCI